MTRSESPVNFLYEFIGRLLMTGHIIRQNEFIHFSDIERLMFHWQQLLVMVHKIQLFIVPHNLKLR